MTKKITPAKPVQPSQPIKTAPTTSEATKREVSLTLRLDPETAKSLEIEILRRTVQDSKNQTNGNWNRQKTIVSILNDWFKTCHENLFQKGLHGDE